MIKKAMIMAAGVGSRLEPLSSVVPKPLVPLANMAAMDILLNHLLSFGIKDVIANTYYRADDIISRYKENSFGIKFNSIIEKELSGTAGGLKKCQFFFDKGEDFIVMSGDGLTDININEAYESHKKSGSFITIVTKEVSHKEVSKYGVIVTDNAGYVESFQEKPAIEEAKSNFVNTGIYIFNYEIFNYIPSDTFYDFAKNVFPFVLNKKIKINTYNMKGYWSDIGSLEQYKISNFDIINNKVSSIKSIVRKTPDGSYICGINLKKGENCKFIGNNIIGNNCTFGNNCIIKDSIIWNNVQLNDNVYVENSIILPNITVSDNLSNEIKSKQSEEKILVR